MNIYTYPLVQSTGATLWGARVGGYVVAHGFKTQQEAYAAALAWQTANGEG